MPEEKLLPLPVALRKVPKGVYWRPNELFIAELSNWLRGKRVLEVFAGNGFLAAHLAQSGVDVMATSRRAGHDAHELGLFFPVDELDAVDACVLHGDDHDVLLMCWPTVTAAALQCARAWGPDKPIVFIGEVSDPAKGMLGGCASDEFFVALDVEFEFTTYAGNWLEKAFVAKLKPAWALT